MFELFENYIPKKFPHRESELNIIDATFKNFKEFGMAINVAIFGKSGAGKSAITKGVMQKHNNCMYVSLTEYNTPNKILRFLTEGKKLSNSELIIDLINQLKNNPKILVFDEVGKSKNIAELSDMINTIYRGTSVPIIIITNKYGFIEEMSEDARLTLLFKRIELPFYDALQVRDVLSSRLDEVKSREIQEVDEDDLRYISARVVREHLSSIRVGLSVLAQCLLSKNFDREIINSAFDDIKKQEFRNLIHNLHPSEAEFLKVLVDLTSAANQEVSSPEIVKHMDSYLSASRISQLITVFDTEYQLINTRFENKGRAGGLHRVISFREDSSRIELSKLLCPWEDKESSKKELVAHT